VSGRWIGTVYLDPASGRESGRRAAGEGFFNALFELHSTLFAGDAGRAVLALAALAYVAMLLSGLILWWPVQWRHAFSVRTRSGSAVVLMDLHRIAGATLGVLVLVSVATGAYMAWRPLAGWVTYLSGQSPAPMPPTGGPVDSSASAAPVGAAMQRAKAHWPGATVSVVHVAAHSLAVVRVRLRLPDDPHPIGMSTAWLDPASGAVRAARRWSELDVGTRAYSFMYPLHTGSLGGTMTLLATYASGIALAGYGSTGLWLWWRRRVASIAGKGTSSHPTRQNCS